MDLLESIWIPIFGKTRNNKSPSESDSNPKNSEKKPWYMNLFGRSS